MVTPLAPACRSDSLSETLLTTASSLQQILQAGGGRALPAILDVRWQLGGQSGRREYADSHIPGAAFVDLDTELAGPAGAEGRHPLPAADAFQAAMRRAGVSAARPVVVYDAANSLAAARAWWLLRYFGHSDVSVLDGGFAAWVRQGGAIETGSARPPPPGDFVARAGGLPVVDAAGAAAVARAGILLDVRTAERFRGEDEPIDPIAGHIPGARNLPAAAALDESGAFRPPDQLRRMFEQAGVEAERDLGAYCGSGVAAAHAVLALELAGFRGALYAGSWSEWITDPDRPVASGD
jgi:thiosulfate/3-mercaptopyruvate sulfurtransferase